MKFFLFTFPYKHVPIGSFVTPSPTLWFLSFFSFWQSCLNLGPQACRPGLYNVSHSMDLPN
jgi:hypothetical protein